MTDTRPLLVDTAEARRLLGGIGKNRFWKIAPRLKSIGNTRKRFWLVSSLERYVEDEANRNQGEAAS
jgi:hypothetical protein